MALLEEIAAYERMRDRLETEHLGEWVIFHDEKLFGTYKDFHDAATDAVENFGRGPYLIREVGACTTRVPMSVMRGSYA